MICAEFDINKALGLRLFDAIRLKGRVLPKGYELAAADIEELKKLGLKKIFAALGEEQDLPFAVALGMIAVKLCGQHTAYTISDDGLVKIIATQDGIFECSEERVAKFNRANEHFVLNTIAIYQPVVAGEIIARLETRLPSLEQEKVDEIIYNLSGNSSLLQIVANLQHRAALLYTHFYNDAEENQLFTNTVEKLVNTMSGLQVALSSEFNALHQVREVSDALEQALRDNIDLVFIISGQSTSCSADTISAALQNVADEVIVSSLPQIGLADLIIGTKRGKKIICLPHNFAFIDSPLLRRYILQVIASDKLLACDFLHPQNITLPSQSPLTVREQARLIGSPQDKISKSTSNVAAIILAAGLSRRTGRNKLLAPLDGEPLFMKSVRAAIKSKANPIYIITGPDHKEIVAALANIDINILPNPNYRSGVKTSISLGLKSLPSNCDGVILIPADQPGLTEKHLNNLIKAYRPSAGASLCVSSLQGSKTNPVLWSCELFADADLMPEDTAGRIIYPQYEDITTRVEAKEKVLQDINTAADLEQISPAEHLKSFKFMD